MQKHIQKKQSPLYPIESSPLYRLKSKKRLAALLKLSIRELLQITSTSSQYYKSFLVKDKSLQIHPCFCKKARTAQLIRNPLKEVHTRLYMYLKRIITPTYLQSAKKGVSYVSNARQHVGDKVVFCTDIKNFYESISFPKIYSFFSNDLHCSPDVSFILTTLCCHNNHMPTGAPFSPLLSFFANKNMFNDVYRYAQLHNITMTLYIDDLTFSSSTITKKNIFDIKGIIQTNGYVTHKDKLYKKTHKKIITGVLVHSNKITVTHKRMLKARLLLSSLKKDPQLQKNRKIASLKGIISEIKQFEPIIANNLLIKLKIFL